MAQCSGRFGAGALGRAPDASRFLARALTSPAAAPRAVNNVGTNIRKPTVEFTSEDFHTLLTVNLESAYNLTQA